MSCALLDNGDVACWGEYVSPNGDSPTPVVVDLENRKAVGISTFMLESITLQRLEDRWRVLESFLFLLIFM